jgi:hypothetical protein
MDSDVVKHELIVFAFNRPEMLRRRLVEISHIEPPQVLVSVDFKDDQTMGEMKSVVAEFSKRWPMNSRLRHHFHERNQGLVRHITDTISESLKSNDCVIVIEDDISISRSFYDSALEYMNSENLRKSYASFGGFSAIPNVRFLEKINMFRTTPYFACWGWTVTKENWIGYRSNLKDIQISEELSRSRIWNELSRTQQNTWLGRFGKAAANPANTWDIQFQFHSFVIDKFNLSPVFRLVDNEGFGDRRSTHTKAGRPRMLGSFRYGQTKLREVIVPRKLAGYLAKYEAIFFYEDLRYLYYLKRLIRSFLRIRF